MPRKGYTYTPERREQNRQNRIIWWKELRADPIRYKEYYDKLVIANRKEGIRRTNPDLPSWYSRNKDKVLSCKRKQQIKFYFYSCGVKFTKGRVAREHEKLLPGHNVSYTTFSRTS